MKQGIIVVGEERSRDAMVSAVEAMGEGTRMAILDGQPTLEYALNHLHSAGVDRIALVPFILGSDETFDVKLQEEIKTAESVKNEVDLAISSPLCPDHRIAGILADRAAQTFSKLDGMAGVPILRIGGKRQADLTYQDLCDLPGQIDDVGTEVPGRHGEAIRIRHLLDPELVPSQPKEVVFHACDDEFSARVPFEMARDKGLFLYRIEGEPLPVNQGGPLRLLIPGIDDHCSNVKHIFRIQLI